MKRQGKAETAGIAQQPRSWDSILGTDKRFSVQTDAGVHIASYTLGTGGHFYGGKAAGA
jgi:hypothetical protein